LPKKCYFILLYIWGCMVNPLQDLAKFSGSALRCFVRTGYFLGFTSWSEK
jgi:hypothetical protein